VIREELKLTGTKFGKTGYVAPQDVAKQRRE